jgi:hypothetical protein
LQSPLEWDVINGWCILFGRVFLFTTATFTTLALAITG